MTKELGMGGHVQPSEGISKGRIAALAIGEFAVLGILAALVITYDLGWVGTVLIAAAVILFTVLLFKASERRAISSGNFSSAMGRYNRRMLIGGLVYMLGLFGAIWVQDALRPEGPLAFLIALAPSVGVLLMIAAMGRLIAEETDEYLRHRYIRSSLFGLGTLLVLATVWGFFEQFDLVPHAPTWVAVPVFALGLGIASCTRWGRE